MACTARVSGTKMERICRQLRSKLERREASFLYPVMFASIKLLELNVPKDLSEFER